MPVLAHQPPRRNMPPLWDKHTNPLMMPATTTTTTMLPAQTKVEETDDGPLSSSLSSSISSSPSTGMASAISSSSDATIPSNQSGLANRPCLHCRTAKVLCDRVLPSCGRCQQRHLECQPQPKDRRGAKVKLHKTKSQMIKEGLIPPPPPPEGTVGAAIAKIDSGSFMGQPRASPQVTEVELVCRSREGICLHLTRMKEQGKLCNAQVLSTIHVFEQLNNRYGHDISLGVLNVQKRVAGGGGPNGNRSGNASAYNLLTTTPSISPSDAVAAASLPPPFSASALAASGLTTTTGLIATAGSSISLGDPNMEPGDSPPPEAWSTDMSWLPRHIKGLWDSCAAVTCHVINGGDFHIFANPKFTQTFMSPEELNQKHKNLGLSMIFAWSRIVAPEDLDSFYRLLVDLIYSEPSPAKETCTICKCINKHGHRFVAVIRVRFMEIIVKQCRAIVASILPLPPSRYNPQRLTAVTSPPPAKRRRVPSPVPSTQGDTTRGHYEAAGGLEEAGKGGGVGSSNSLALLSGARAPMPGLSSSPNRSPSPQGDDARANSRSVLFFPTAQTTLNPQTNLTLNPTSTMPFGATFFTTFYPAPASAATPGGAGGERSNQGGYPYPTGAGANPSAADGIVPSYDLPAPPPSYINTLI